MRYIVPLTLGVELVIVMTMGQLRARLEDEKAGRRAAILEAAAAIWQKTGYDAFRMADLAAKTGLAKGTLYIYFTSKEHLFLDLIDSRVHPWMDKLQAALTPLRDAGAKEIAKLVRRELEADPMLDQLLPILESTIERGVAEAVVKDFRQRLSEHAAALAAKIESSMAELQKGQGTQAYGLIRALHAGYKHVGNDSVDDFENGLASALRGLTRKKKKKDKVRK